MIVPEDAKTGWTHDRFPSAAAWDKKRLHLLIETKSTWHFAIGV